MRLRRQDIALVHGTVMVQVTRTVKMDGIVVVKASKTDAGARSLAVPRAASDRPHLVPGGAGAGPGPHLRNWRVHVAEHIVTEV